MRVCSGPTGTGCPTGSLVQGKTRRCGQCAREYEQARGSSSARGYGTEHRNLRRELAPKAIGQLCHHCNKPMLVGQPLALDHAEDRTGYRGMSHASCNNADGGRRSHN